MLLLHGGGAVEPADFGTLAAWFDPRFEITHSGDLTAVTDWNDHSGAARDGTIVGAPTYEATGWNGKPSVSCDGTDDGIVCASLGAVFAGSDIPFYVVCAMQCTSLPGALEKPLALGVTGSAAQVHAIEWINATNNWGLKRNDAATNKFHTGTNNSLDTSRHVISFQFTGTLGTLTEDGASVGLDNKDLDVGSITFNSFSLGFWRASTDKEWANVRFGPVLVYSALTNEAGARQWLIDQGYGP